MFSRFITLGLLVFGIQVSALPSTLEARQTIETYSVCPSADNYSFEPAGSTLPWTILCGNDVNDGNDLGQITAGNLFECQQGCSNYNIGYDYVACGAVAFVPGWNSGIGNCFFKGYPFVLSNNSAVESAVTTTY